MLHRRADARDSMSCRPLALLAHRLMIRGFGCGWMGGGCRWMVGFDKIATAPHSVPNRQGDARLGRPMVFGVGFFYSTVWAVKGVGDTMRYQIGNYMCHAS
ncbi:hypothetical protein B0T16DRAFT_409575 [Cercophora newfieldiana]|uniref:Uncharacterized protein n=1 Tax=Cercophora newfieldiana TaxID=92897 RepID=A0AA39YAS5_9PEZI|nr:hypothetical protein B0T16DRAFT_409575 [Cercophora newfieldiana]